MLVDSMAGDSLSDNLNPVARVYYAFATRVCVPCSLGQEVGTALCDQAGEKRLAEILHESGFSRVRQAAETLSSMIHEARL
jgi:hypothetical protein